MDYGKLGAEIFLLALSLSVPEHAFISDLRLLLACYNRRHLLVFLDPHGATRSTLAFLAAAAMASRDNLLTSSHILRAVQFNSLPYNFAFFIAVIEFSFLFSFTQRVILVLRLMCRYVEEDGKLQDD